MGPTEVSPVSTTAGSSAGDAADGETDKACFNCQWDLDSKYLWDEKSIVDDQNNVNYIGI